VRGDERWSEIEGLLDRLLDAPEERRGELLAQECGADEAFASRVRELLAAASRESVLDRPAAAWTPTLAEAAIAVVDSGEVSGERLGPWRLGATLGEGGMGRVYRAERADGQFERTVAIKIVASPLAGEASRQRFWRERQILANLRHDHIAQLLDGGVAADGRPWFALEHVDGRPITAFAAESGLSREARVALLLQACDAVAHANSQGIVHRDLKPSNLLVADAPDGPHLYVLDFGIARGEGVAGPTLAGDVIGTPGYMAPEQARGEVASIDRRADVFSLGVVLYELLCDRRPFAGETASEVLAALLTSEPPSPRTLVPELPRDLETIVLGCLDKRPERRYAAVPALAADLRAWMAGDPIAARPASLPRRLARTARRHPLMAGTAAALALATAVGSIIAIRGARAAREQAEATRRFGALAEEVAAAMRFEYLAPLHDVTPARSALAARLDALEEELARASPVARAAGRIARGRGRLTLGDLDGAFADLDAAWRAGARTADAATALAEIAVASFAKDRASTESIADPALRRARLTEIDERARADARALAAFALATGGAGAEWQRELIVARLSYLRGELDKAKRLADRAAIAFPWLHEARLLGGEIELAFASRERENGETSGLAARLSSATEAFRAAVEIGRSDPAAHVKLCGVAATGLDLALHVVELDPEPLAELAGAACADAARAAPGDPAAPILESTARTAYARELSRHDLDPFPAIAAAAAAARRAVALAPDSGEARRRLGDALAFRAEFERERGSDPHAAIAESIAALERAAELAPDDAGVWNSLGLARWEVMLSASERGEPYRRPAEEAAAAFERAVALEPRYAYAWGNLGSMRNRAGEAALREGGDPEAAWSAAVAAFERALAVYPDYATAVNNLGNVLRNLGEHRWQRGEDARAEYARAVAQFDRAVALRPDWFVPYVNRANSYLALAMARVRGGESGEREIELARSDIATGLKLRATNVQSRVLAAEIELFALARERRASESGGASDAAERRTRAAIAGVRSLDPSAAAPLERDLGAMLRGEPTEHDPVAPTGPR